MINEIVKHYKVYIDRNDTLEEFASDVNTLGGTISFGWVDTDKKFIYAKDKDFNLLKKIPLSDVWEIVKSPQQSLF